MSVHFFLQITALKKKLYVFRPILGDTVLQRALRFTKYPSNVLNAPTRIRLQAVKALKLQLGPIVPSFSYSESKQL